MKTLETIYGNTLPDTRSRAGVCLNPTVLSHRLSLQSGPILPRDRTAPLSPDLWSLGLTQRILLLALLFAAELIIISVWLDSADLAAGGNLLPMISSEGPWFLRCIVGFAALFLTFAYLKNRPALDRISSEVVRLPVGWGLLAGHFAAMAVFAGLSSILFRGSLPVPLTDLIAASWLAVGAAAIAFAAFAFLPPKLWVGVVASAGHWWAYALVAVSAANYVGNASRSLGESAASLAFSLSKAFLSLFVSGVIADPATLKLPRISHQE